MLRKTISENAAVFVVTKKEGRKTLEGHTNS